MGEWDLTSPQTVPSVFGIFFQLTLLRWDWEEEEEGREGGGGGGTGMPPGPISGVGGGGGMSPGVEAAVMSAVLEVGVAGGVALEEHLC